MPVLCPVSVEGPDGRQCGPNTHVIESNFAGLFKTEICIYQCGDGFYVMRWQHKFLFFRSEIQQRLLQELQ